jgi:glycosyltransferase involved in cell wall biosynthesis
VTSPAALPDRPRVLIVGPGPDSAGGVWAVIDTLTRSTLARDFSLRHIATHRDGPARVKLEAAATGIGRVARELARRRTDLLWVHVSADFSFRRKTAVVTLGRLFRVPIVLHVHGSDVEVWYRATAAAEKAMVRKVLRSADLVVALTPTWEARLHDMTDCRTTSIMNPVAVPPPPDPAGRVPGRIVSLGRLGERKGSKVLVEAVAILAGEGRDVSLVLAGDGEREAVEERARELGVADRVEIRSWIGPEEVAELLSSASVFALPSREEGLPVALLEAMAHALPAVVTPVGGIPDLVTDGETGRMVRPDDPPGLAAVLRELVDDPAAAAALGIAGRAEVERRCAVPVVVARLGDEFRGVLARRAP